MVAASALSLGLLLLSRTAAADQEQDGSRARLQVPISGTVSGGGKLAGTLSIQKFSEVNGQLVAIGMISGSITDSAGAPVGTALVGPLSLPVQLGPRSAAAVSSAAPVAPQAQTCQVLNISIGAVSFNVLGLQVTTQPISLDLSAVSGGTNVLGQLICTILQTAGSVVNLLNTLLGLLGGLTGGLTGG
jgi:hypothetical protein